MKIFTNNTKRSSSGKWHKEALIGFMLGCILTLSGLIWWACGDRGYKV